MTEEERRKLAKRLPNAVKASPGASPAGRWVRELKRHRIAFDDCVFYQTHPDSDHALSKLLVTSKISAVWLPSEAHLHIREHEYPAAPEKVHVNPPGLGEALLVIFAPKRRVDAMLGDLAERFNDDVEEKGLKRARLLYWARVLQSIGPMLWTKVRKAGIFITICEISRRWIGS
jgi:hypothetical protein